MYVAAKILEAGLDHIRRSPSDGGELRLIASRPANLERAVLDEAELDPVVGLVGDNWLARGSRHSVDGSADPERQLTLMNIRVAELVAGSLERVPLAGDQLYVDFDLSIDNLPPGSRLVIGTAELEVSAAPHLGCAKFVNRFGPEAMRFVNSRIGRRLRLRGMNARVIVGGAIRVGDGVSRMAFAARACAAGSPAPPEWLAPPASQARRPAQGRAQRPARRVRRTNG